MGLENLAQFWHIILIVIAESGNLFNRLAQLSTENQLCTKMDISGIRDFDWIFDHPELMEFSKFMAKTLPLLVPLSEEEYQVYESDKDDHRDGGPVLKSKIFDAINHDQNVSKYPDTAFFLENDIKILESRVTDYEQMIKRQQGVEDLVVDIELLSRQYSVKVVKKTEEIENVKQSLESAIKQLEQFSKDAQIMPIIEPYSFKSDWYPSFKAQIDELLEDCPELGDENLLQLNVRVEMQRIELEATQIYIDSVNRQTLENLDNEIITQSDMKRFKVELQNKLLELEPVVKESVKEKLVKPKVEIMLAKQIKLQKLVLEMVTEKIRMITEINIGLESNLNRIVCYWEELQTCKNYLVDASAAFQVFNEKYQQIVQDMKAFQNTSSNFIPLSCKELFDLFGNSLF